MLTRLILAAALALALVAPVNAKERLELEVPDYVQQPPPILTTWWEVVKIDTDERLHTVAIQVRGANNMIRTCTEEGPEADALIQNLRVPSMKSRDWVALRHIMAMGCVGRGSIMGRP